MHLQSQLELSVGQATDAGRKSDNEDCIGIRIPSQPALTLKGAVAVIADGVSAAEAGKIASETCVRNFISDYYGSPDAWSVKTAGQKILNALNRWLLGQSQLKGHVTTLSIIIFKSQRAYVFHVGDTRIYRLRDDTFECITHDHTAHIHGDTAYLARAMGMDSRLEMDYLELDVVEGDTYFLSTDGIHDVLPEKHVHQRLNQKTADYESLCRGLIEDALSAGSDDNLSCQIVHIDALPPLDEEDIYKKLSDLPFPPPLEQGQSLDGLTVLKELHASQRSQLYLVEDEQKKRFVLKTPSLNYEDDAAYIERFMLEHWTGKRIESPYVVKVVDRKTRPNFLYTVMEYVEGMTLERWMKENPKPNIQEVIRIADGISRGLRAFHRRDVLHQDIKPDNVILDLQGNPKVIDFGSCYVSGIEEIDRPFDREEALGTAEYSAPETRFRKQKTFKSDLFSLAVVIYEMLTGTMPFSGALAQLKDERKVSQLKYVPASLLNPMIPNWLDGALELALSPYPDRRPSSLSEFIYDLQHPNRRYIRTDSLPLLERNPLRFWKSLAVIEGLVLMGLLVWFIHRG